MLTGQIQVRILVGEPITPRSSSWPGHAGSQPADRSSSLRRGTRCTRSSMEEPRLRIGKVQVRVLPCAANHQRVGEPGRPCLPWKQEIGGSNPPTLTIHSRTTGARHERHQGLRRARAQDARADASAAWRSAAPSPACSAPTATSATRSRSAASSPTRSTSPSAASASTSAAATWRSGSIRSYADDRRRVATIISTTSRRAI